MMSQMSPSVVASGGRKASQARVRLVPGTGAITVNSRPIEQHLPKGPLLTTVRQPLAVANAEGRFDVIASVVGGGVVGQAGALVAIDPELRSAMRKAGFLTRDPRTKERKKYGHKRARKGFQYSKR